MEVPWVFLFESLRVDDAIIRGKREGEENSGLVDTRLLGVLLSGLFTPDQGRNYGQILFNFQLRPYDS